MPNAPITTPVTVPSVQPAALRFFKATALKRICFNDGFVEIGGPMFVAKWEGLYVIAKNASNYFIETEAKAAEYVRTERNDKNKLVVAHDGPVIRPVGEKFEWTVELGCSCPDDCDETISSSRKVNNKAEALAMVANLTEPASNPRRGFARIRGPGFYQFTRPERVAVAPPPAPRPTPPAVSVPRPAPTPVRRAAEAIRENSYRYANYELQDDYDTFGSGRTYGSYEHPRRYDERFYNLRPTRNFNAIEDYRVTEEILRMVREFQNIRNNGTPVGTSEVPATQPANPTPPTNSTNNN
jgi:hypothetical protein